MKRSIAYFNFGFLLTALAIVAQVILKIILVIFGCQGADLLTLCFPPLLILILGFVWYKQEISMLKIEQYFLAGMPLLLFLLSGLSVSLENLLPLHLHDLLIILFLVSYISVRIMIDQLSAKFKDDKIINSLYFEAFFYLIGCNLALWLFAYWLFL
jgi:hypothetical protein